MCALAFPVPQQDRVSLLSSAPDPLTVAVHAADPVSRAGIVGQLEQFPGVEVVTDRAAVAIVVADEVDDETLRVLRSLPRKDGPRVVLVVTHLEDSGLLAAVEAGVCGLLRRNEAVPDRVFTALKAAVSGDGTLPPDLLGRLLKQMGQLQRHVLGPRGLTFSGLTDREIQVLRLVADGYSTAEIAHELSYSERTIKNVIQDVVSRFHLRNRSHAVAYAIRQGLI